jgi:hypothetical protein
MVDKRVDRVFWSHVIFCGEGINFVMNVSFDCKIQLYEEIKIFLLTSCTFMFVWFFITETKHVISCFELRIVSCTQQISDIKKVNKCVGII